MSAEHDPIVIEARVSVTLGEVSGDPDTRRAAAEGQIRSRLTQLLVDDGIAGPGESVDGWSLNLGGDASPEDHELQSMIAADLNSVSGNDSMLDGIVELMSEDALEALMASMERVALDRKREEDMRP